MSSSVAALALVPPSTAALSLCCRAVRVEWRSAKKIRRKATATATSTATAAALTIAVQMLAAAEEQRPP